MERGKDNDGEMLYSETPVLHRVETALLTCIICGCAHSEYLHKMDSFMIDRLIHDAWQQKQDGFLSGPCFFPSFLRPSCFISLLFLLSVSLHFFCKTIQIVKFDAVKDCHCGVEMLYIGCDYTFSDPALHQAIVKDASGRQAGI